MWFVNLFDPKKDILYGIGSQITKYLLYYFRKTHRGRFFMGDIRKFYAYTAINKYNMPITRTNLIMDTNQIQVGMVGSEEDLIQQDYMVELAKSKYKPGTVLGDYFEQWEKLRKSNANLQIP
jgi:hypothetical protein